MNRFAALLDRLTYEQRRNAKLRLLEDYFRHTPDPERGYALAAMTDALVFKEAKPNVIRGLVEERVDPVLFRMSYHYVGDLAETVALIWPGSMGARGSARDQSVPPHAEVRAEGEPRSTHEGAAAVGRPLKHPSRPATRAPQDEGGGRGEEPPAMGHNNPPPPSLAEVVEALGRTSKSDLPARLAEWLHALDETGRWALIKLITGELRVGASGRLAKTAVANLGGFSADDVELIWHGLEAPYEELFAWVEGRGPKPESGNPAPFRPPMLSHPLEDEDFAKLDPADHLGEWKWDGIRLQAVAGRDAEGGLVRRIYSRTGEDVSKAFPDLVEALTFEGAIDGELLIVREGRVQSFNVLQQRLNRKTVTQKLVAEFPVHLRVYDLLVEGDEDLRALPFDERRRRLEAFVARLHDPRIDLSPWWRSPPGRSSPPPGPTRPRSAPVRTRTPSRASWSSAPTAPTCPGRPEGPLVASGSASPISSTR
jgi:DNA ligase-1